VVLVQLAHFGAAARYRSILLITGSILAGVGFFLIGAVLVNATGLPVPQFLGYLGAALLIAAAGFLPAGMIATARYRLCTAVGSANNEKIVRTGAPETALGGREKRGFPALPTALRRVGEGFAGWPQVLVAAALGVSAALGVLAVWSGAAAPALNASMAQVVGGLLLIGAFPLLVLERIYGNIAPRVLPDAPRLNRLLRVPLTASVGLGLALILQSVGFGWARKFETAVGALVLLVSAELVLRACAALFLPFAPLAERCSAANSSIAALLSLGMPRLASLNAAVERQFGIDLSRSWALTFLRRALLPLASAIGVAAWAVTGVTGLGFDERAVYERLGVPVAVLGPGLHFHLPWPFGVMRKVELGVVHEIPIVFQAAGARSRPGLASETSNPTRQPSPAEGQAPAGADRLWDTSHPWEASYLIASERRGQQGFQVVAVDMRVVYRIGLSEEAAQDAAYRIEDPESLIRGIAGQLLVRHFSRYTLLDVLGQSREVFAGEFRAVLQEELDRLATGIEAIAVVVEAIHPPPGAAQAYHAVQAAELLAKAQIARNRGDAVRRIKSAEQTALQDRDAALVAAAELVQQAQGEAVLFDADRQAYRHAGEAFLLERRFDRLGKGLTNSELLIIDRGLGGQNSPTIDLRRFGFPAAEGGSAGAAPPAGGDADRRPPPDGKD
jgi:regulator of protease activity HflC (stomatin/prohibitin superfamily)